MQGEPVKKSIDTSEEENPNGALYYAFIYLTIFFLVFVVTVQFNPLILYLYPLVLLVPVLTLLFVVVSILEMKQKKIPTPKAISPAFPLILALITAIILFLQTILKSPLLLLLIPTILVILFLEGHVINTYDQDKST